MDLAAIALTGSLPGFWRWTIATLVGYASSSWAPAYVWSRARDSLVPFVLDDAVLWIAAIAVAARWRSLTRETRLIVVWLALGMAGSVAGGHLSWHYFVQAMGPLAVLGALAFDRFQVRRVVAVAAAIGIAIPAVAWLAFDLAADPLTYDFGPPPPAHEAVAAYIRAHTSTSDRIFVWGDWAATGSLAWGAGTAGATGRAGRAGAAGTAGTAGAAATGGAPGFCTGTVGEGSGGTTRGWTTTGFA